MLPPPHSLDHLLSAASFLAGAHATGEPQQDLTALLKARLAKYHKHLQHDDKRPDNAHGAELETAVESLNVVEAVQRYLEPEIIDTAQGSAVTESAQTAQKQPADASTKDEGATALGTRDMAHLRTLISIIFKWGTEPLLARVLSTLPRQPPSKEVDKGPRIIDLTFVPEDFDLLVSLVTRVHALLFPQRAQGHPSKTFIATTLFTRHGTEILRSSIFLAWIPPSWAKDFFPCVEGLRARIMSFLTTQPPSQAIVALGPIVTNYSLPAFTRVMGGRLLSLQILRPQGVRGLFASMFGEGEVSRCESLEMLVHVARALTAIPSHMPREKYFGIVIPCVIDMLTPAMADRTPSAYKRAAAFTISRMISPEDQSFVHREFATGMILSILHKPFLHVQPSPQPISSPPVQPESTVEGNAPPARQPSAVTKLSAIDALQTLGVLILNTDPSPTLISTLLTPVISKIYSLHEYLQGMKTADPSLREGVNGMLKTWARAADKGECVDALWSIINGSGCDWAVDVSGKLKVVERFSDLPSVFLLDLAKKSGEHDDDEIDVDSNPLNLRPDPAMFIRFIKSVDREDVASELFVRLLDAYQEDQKVKSGVEEEDPIRTLLRLQLILQMQTQLIDSASSTNILKKPTHILSFIKHALESGTSVGESRQGGANKDSRSLRIADLRIVPEDDNDDMSNLPPSGGDSDDEEEEVPGLEGVQPGDEMSVTAINLLLALLEAHPDLSARTASILNDIFELLEPIANGSSDIMRPLAREARLVMTARLASTSNAASGNDTRKRGQKRSEEEENVQEAYQRALKLLQDPILPVRAHGLLVLRQLVAPQTSKPQSSQKQPQQKQKGGSTLDPALIPGILSVFLESVQDDDSYIFLNAVQGLAAMVEGFGKDVLKGLVGVYTNGIVDGSAKMDAKGVYAKGPDVIGGVTLSRRDVDVRVRVGEALGQVIRRCGGALGIYVDIIVPPLFAMVRASSLPTTLRSSAISLLSTCASTNGLAMLPYSADLFDAMVDLLRVESVPAKHSRPDEKKPALAQPASTEPAGIPALPGKVPGTQQQQKPPKEQRAPGNVSKSNEVADSEATAVNSKLPPLRRAALHFLSMLLSETTLQVMKDAKSPRDEFRTTLGGVGAVARAKTVLGYVAATDEDGVVRLMAREATQAMDSLRDAMMGL
ncbi:hypothetical protein BD410DRAFT_817858 [Rickenella mellea]|uniref:RNA polymerase II assembly factor Rtp1 C-terminal domain-containing protein n=1 Tax=Rickenella mellea TaxID=50990 RepID=A0A4R5XFP3_9AGAM|nr:hypothetical protein BD410DRAFT_817858 [Rickenella mellea]